MLYLFSFVFIYCLNPSVRRATEKYVQTVEMIQFCVQHKHTKILIQLGETTPQYIIPFTLSQSHFHYIVL